MKSFTGESGFYRCLADMAVCGRPDDEAYSRLLQDIYGPLIQSLDREREKCSDEDFYFATASLVVALTITAYTRFRDESEHAAALRIAAKYIPLHLEDAARDIERSNQ